MSSTHHNLERVVEFLEAFALDHEWEPELRDRVVLVGSEVVTNAMDHGNHFDPGKSVKVRLLNSAGEVELVVEDEGDGFDRSNVANPLAKENLLRDSGRGLLIIEELTDRVRYEYEGRRVRLTFVRHGQDGAVNDTEETD